MRRPSPLLRHAAAFAAAALLCSAAIAADPTAAKAAPDDAAAKDDYIRFVDEEARAQLQTAVVHYEHPDGSEVDLIGVVHIGDEAYYKTLNDSFKAYDALLFEMVGADPDKPLTKEDLQKNKKSPLRFFQLLTAGMLDLKFQLDHIDYTATNFVHADMDMETFQRRQKEKGENLLSLIEKGFESQQKSSKEPGETFDFNEMFKLFQSDSTPAGNKLTLGKQFHNIEGLLGGMEGKDGSVLVAERNLAALKVMQREIAAGKKKLGIFYGAAHLGDFDKRLRKEHGFKRGETDWVTSWDIDKAEAVPAGEPEEKADDEGQDEEPELKKAA